MDQWEKLKQGATYKTILRKAHTNKATITSETVTIYDDDGNELYVFDVSDSKVRQP